MTTEAEMKPQHTLRMTENQCNYVALAQRVHNSLMAEGQALVNQGNAKAQEGQAALRQAVEGAFKEHNQTIPTAEVRIVNDERGRPAVLVWTDSPAPEGTSEAEAVGEEKPTRRHRVRARGEGEGRERELPPRRVAREDRRDGAGGTPGTRSHSDEFLDKTIAHWQPLSTEKLTREDAREITDNLVAFAECLLEMDRNMRARGVDIVASSPATNRRAGRRRSGDEHRDGSHE